MLEDRLPLAVASDAQFRAGRHVHGVDNVRAGGDVERAVSDLIDAGCECARVVVRAVAHGTKRLDAG